MLAIVVHVLHAAGGYTFDDSAQGPKVSAIEGTPTNNLWKQGYGFNNPNVDRIRDGKQPVAFPGSPRDDDGPGAKIEYTVPGF